MVTPKLVLPLSRGNYRPASPAVVLLHRRMKRPAKIKERREWKGRPREYNHTRMTVH